MGSSSVPPGLQGSWVNCWLDATLKNLEYPLELLDVVFMAQVGLGPQTPTSTALMVTAIPVPLQASLPALDGTEKALLDREWH